MNDTAKKLKKWTDIEGWFLETQGLVLQRLALDKVCVEIGNYKGRSTLCLAEVALHVYAIDIKKWPGFEDNIVGYPITVFTMPSVTGSKQFERESVDLVFIDSNHLYQDVKLDILSWWDKLRLNGVMCFHDYKAPGHDGVAAAVNEVFGLAMVNNTVNVAWVVKNEKSSDQIYKYTILQIKTK